MHNYNITSTLSLVVLLFLFSIEVGWSQSFDSDKPEVIFNKKYSQVFSSSNDWNNELFYGQWDAVEPNIFKAEDVVSNYLRFEWIKKRIIISKQSYSSPFVFETDLDYSSGSNRGGIVIRANPISVEHVQEPAQGDPGFNSEGIAFYPSADGNSMIVQFTGTFNSKNTPVARFSIPKPEGVVNMMGRGTLRVEDFIRTIYVYYNLVPFIRIDLGSMSGNLYSSGTVYNAKMQIAGTFANMEVHAAGKIAIAQRDATLRLYGVTIQSNDLEKQAISFENPGKKLITDAPFNLKATATSSLPVEFKLVSGPATLNGNIVTLTGQTGLITLTANQSGNSVYNPAPEVIRTVYVSDPVFSNVPPSSQDYVDNWVVTDALGRNSVWYNEARPKQNNKYVGVFYYVWHGYHGNLVNDITKILKNYPADPLGPSNPGWGGKNSFHWWGEPEQGYHRAEDPWVLRRDLQMLSNAHVDFLYIDVTNAVTYDAEIKALCEVSLQMRKEGIYTPQIVFATNSKSGQVINYLYDQYYAQFLFNELWFNWNGKPLILGNFNDAELRSEVKDYFTIKYSWAWTNAATEPNHWQWLDKYPQDFGWTTNPTVPEQIPVGVAEHPTHTHGKSFSNNKEPVVNNDYVTEFTDFGLNFSEQWRKALEVNPPVVMVTQWNEWIAQRFIWENGNSTYAGKPIKNGDTYFVDVFNREFNRDIAPMKGGYTDNYYYLLVSNIRKYKGMSSPEPYSLSKTILIDGHLDEWTTVTPVYKDPPGDTMHRNFRGYQTGTMFVNSTGRNDILESRSVYDQNSLYFYVKTANTITPSNDRNWMLLFLDTDRSKGTGWEGYDFAVNLEVVSDTLSTVKRWNGRQWENAGSVVYRVKRSEMELSVPRNVLGLSTGIPEFYFHWADNPQHLNDITSFFTDGESAPDRRFNYNFSTSKLIIQEQSAYKNLVIPGTIEFEDFDKGGAGVAYADADIANQGGKYRNIESVDIAQKAENEYCLFKINKEEWLEYSVKVNAIGKFKAAIHYLAETAGSKALLSFDGQSMTDTIPLPSTAGKWSTLNLDLQLTAGQKLMKFSIVEATEDLKLDKVVISELDVVYPGTGKGLEKTFWTGEVGGRNWFKDSVCTETDPVIDEIWADVSPGCNLPKDFWNVRWLGKIEPLYSEEYTFYLTVNNMGRLWVNDVLLIDAWISTATGKTHTGKISLVAGQKVNIRVDFAEVSGDANVKLEWESQSNSREIVPQYQFYTNVLNTSAEEVDANVIRFYPNPASDRITVESNSIEIKYLTITDICGRNVFETRESFQGAKTIDTSYLKNGIYILKLGAETQEYVKKIIKR